MPGRSCLNSCTHVKPRSRIKLKILQNTLSSTQLCARGPWLVKPLMPSCRSRSRFTIGLTGLYIPVQQRCELHSPHTAQLLLPFWRAIGSIRATSHGETRHRHPADARPRGPPKDLDFGFGFLPVLSEMGEIREFRCFSVIQIWIFGQILPKF
jgi:hypothetical protein